MSNKSKELSKEQLIDIMHRKKLATDKALKIVESLIEEKIQTEEFLDKLQYITRQHYDDIVEERSIQSLCGYSLCDNKLNLPSSQKYHICTTRCKVYDITERQKFHSAKCYKRSNYIRNQISDSPLWLRSPNLDEFKLLK